MSTKRNSIWLLSLLSYPRSIYFFACCITNTRGFSFDSNKFSNPFLFWDIYSFRRNKHVFHYFGSISFFCISFNKNWNRSPIHQQFYSSCILFVNYVKYSFVLRYLFSQMLYFWNITIIIVIFFVIIILFLVWFESNWFRL